MTECNDVVICHSTETTSVPQKNYVQQV